MSSLVGTVLSQKYELVELIGTGGMADVYKARDTRLGRNVAVKVLKPEYNGDQEFINRFQTESKAMAKLSDANIVNVYDVGFDDNLNYIVMELVKGNTLKEYLDRILGFMKEEVVINIGIQICKALGQAHNNRIVHRDIKAQNILIDTDGKIKVADFGIARAATNQTIVKDSEIFGSVHYASPEQARGKNVDRRSDLYSLGILLYELLTRELPFEADSAVNVAMMQMKVKMPDPRDKNPAVTKGMAKIIAIATRKKPNERYQNAYEMASDLQKLRSDPDFIPIEKTIINSKEIKDDLLTDNDSAYDYELEGPETTKTGYMISALLGIFLAIIISTFVLVGIVKDRKAASIVIMPDVVNITLKEAEERLAEIGVKAEVVETRASDEIARDYVISASVDKGEKIKRNYTVQLVVSSGGQKIRVPILLDLTLEEAKELIKREGFVFGNVKEEFSDKPAGNVIAQEPSSGEMKDKNTIIDLVISKGEEQKNVFVPSLKGLTLRDAYSTLGRNNLEMGEITREYNDEVEKDRVISSTRVGDSVAPGTLIDVVVSNGPEPSEEDITEPTSQGGDESGEGEGGGEGEGSDGEGSGEGDNSGESGDMVTVTITVNLKSELFEQDPSEIRIELISDGQEKTVVYQGQHYASEGDVIPIQLELTGKGYGKLIIRYDTFIKDEIDFKFE